MKNSILNIGKVLNKKELLNIKGSSVTGSFLESRCYAEQSSCLAALSSVLGYGANPNDGRCVSCITESGESGFKVRVGSVL
ncbi:hypothetical protein [uncultured Tenacibaculum sp.]|uniref:hypothetical protein n=1 Tax=uncultured Tenacibaculum sp. TaxID=174713 RepID=UPI0026371EAB|nr:hypothetical protein [uncultured Tenacibaculum sp.]